MKYKVISPDKTETKFEDKQAAFRFALQRSQQTNKLIKVDSSNDEFDWEQIALVYPSGKIQEGTGGFGFFKKLPVGRVRH